jgi:hypothetical protein
MITHIDNTGKLNDLKNKMQYAEMGICMSKETVDNLSNVGISRSKLCFVNPAHDGIIKPRRIILGITCRVQRDGRKREYMIDELADFLNPSEFEFRIMGEFWNPQVERLRQRGFLVEYYENFDYEEYIKLIPSLDYYIYTGLDEGQMGFVDALAAGVKTIVTPQGYHLDAANGITYPFIELKDFLKCFEKISQERGILVNAVEKWNWESYTQKHIEIWGYLLSKSKASDKPVIDFIDSIDGLASVEEYSKNKVLLSSNEKVSIFLKMFFERFRQYYHIKINKNRND